MAKDYGCIRPGDLRPGRRGSTRRPWHGIRRRRRVLPAGRRPPPAGASATGRRVDRAGRGHAPGGARPITPASAWPGRRWAVRPRPPRPSARCWLSTRTTPRPTSIAGSSSAPWAIARRPWRTSAAPSSSTLGWPRPGPTSASCCWSSAGRRGAAALPGRRRARARTWWRPTSTWATSCSPRPARGGRATAYSTRIRLDPNRAQAAAGIGLIAAPPGTSGMRRWPGSAGPSSSSRGPSSSSDTWRRPRPCRGSTPRCRRAASGSSRSTRIMRSPTTPWAGSSTAQAGTTRPGGTTATAIRLEPDLAIGPFQPRRAPRGDGRAGRSRGPLTGPHAALRPGPRDGPGPPGAPCSREPCPTPTSRRPASAAPRSRACRRATGPSSSSPSAEVHDARGEFSGGRRVPRAGQRLALRRAETARTRLRPGRTSASSSTPSSPAFTPDLFDRLAGAGLDTPRPVFIIGLPRSGTTLIEQILASHPEVHGAGEIPLARRSLEELPGDWVAPIRR